MVDFSETVKLKEICPELEKIRRNCLSKFERFSRNCLSKLERILSKKEKLLSNFSEAYEGTLP
jgi:hypothetical protein